MNSHRAYLLACALMVIATFAFFGLALPAVIDYALA